MRLFTIGYEKRGIDDFVGLLLERRVTVVVDVRETPWSHKADFCKTRLEEALRRSGLGYRHARFAGNPKAFRDAATSPADCLRRFRSYALRKTSVVDQLVELLEELRQEGETAALLCYERHAVECHRGILAELVAEARGGVRVTHIEDAPPASVRRGKSVSRSSGTTGQLFRNS